MVLKKTKARVAGAHEMRNAEIHMNQRLQVLSFPALRLYRIQNKEI